jgi:hypothetical protein
VQGKGNLTLPITTGCEGLRFWLLGGTVGKFGALKVSDSLCQNCETESEIGLLFKVSWSLQLLLIFLMYNHKSVTIPINLKC